MAGSDFEALVLSIRGAVNDAGSAGIAHSALLKRKGISKFDDRQVAGAIARLDALGDVRLRENAGRGRPGNKYYGRGALPMRPRPIKRRLLQM
jgi:hypothetical protein